MSKKLLLADDSITIQKVIQITFAHEDYELTITDNGDAALLKAQEIKPDLIMSDVYMPGKNGYELTTAVKQDPALQHVPVLLLAGSFEPFDEDKARSCKADAWIEKPFESQNLIDKVAELLSAAAEAAVTPAPVVEPAPVAEPVAAVEPAAFADFAIEEEPLASFEAAPVGAPEVSDDPFGDISFDEETPVVAPAPVSIPDDWGDVAAEATLTEPAAPEAFAAETPVAAVADDFSFADEEPLPVADFAEVEEVGAADAGLDVFDMGDDDIMPLDDDDILGEEDLEPPLPEQTLAAWSRDDAAEDVFAEPLSEVPSVEDEDVFAVEPMAEVADVVAPAPEVDLAPAVEEFTAFAEEPVLEEEPVAVAPVAAEVEPAAAIAEQAPAVSAVEEPVPAVSVVEEPVPAVPVVEEPEAAAVVSAADVEAKASALGEEELEQIIEKVVTKVVEKLAGSILERVAWEVVPDLAESLIREEIRKIKDTAA